MLWFSRLRPAGRDAELVRHPHQSDQGLRLHLPRDLAAMHLHRHLAQIELGGDLFVRTTGHDEREHFPLAHRQRGEARLRQRELNRPDCRQISFCLHRRGWALRSVRRAATLALRPRDAYVSVLQRRCSRRNSRVSTNRMHISRLAPPASFLSSPGAPAVEWRVAPGLTAYTEAVAEMEARATAIAEGRAAERVWLVEHPPLYTAGTSARDGDLSTRAFPCIAPGAAASSPITGPGSASPMSCSTSGAVAPTCAPSSARWSAG